jgi:UDP-N-acetylglucosamine 2-epimerase (non-hydrolysing)
LAARLPFVFPVHPRTRARLTSAGIVLPSPRWILTEPLGYMEFLALQSSARLVMTDSGGVQEETTALGVPCITLRENTERPCTVTEGTNRIAGTSRQGILAAFDLAMRTSASHDRPRVPALWDGHAADRVTAILLRLFEESVGASTDGARRLSA